MCPLLNLPKEIRLQIIEFSLLIRDPVTIQQAHFRPIISEARQAVLQYAPFEQRVEHYPLLLVNHQLRSETLALLNGRSQTPFQIDVILRCDQQLVIFMPAQRKSTQYFDNVSVNLYITGDGQIPWYRRYQSGNGGPPGSCWNLLKALKDFLHYGPTAQHSADNTGEGIYVRIMDLRVSSQSSIPESILGPRNVAPGDEYDCDGTRRAIGRLKTFSAESGVRYTMHPDFLVLLLRELVGLLVCVQNGRVVFERVGAIRLLLDGKCVCFWDLSEYSDNMFCSDEDHGI
ncbi:hypothetical protein BJX64DRAFT_271414 [Aspergillus heterothallicus]